MPPHPPHVSRCRNDKAFTLIELLVTIAIVAILFAIAVPSYSTIMDRTAISKAQSKHMRGLAVAMAGYRADNNNQWPMPKKTGSFTNEFYSWYGPPTDEANGKLAMKTLRPYYGEGDLKEDGTFKDPWGTQYAMKWDVDNSGGVEYYGKGNKENIRSEFIIVSLGKNKTQDDPAKKDTFDDVFSFAPYRDFSNFQ